MRTINKVTLVGEVAADMDERTKADGGRVGYFSLATHRTENGQRVTDWHRVKMENHVFLTLNDFVRRGCRVYVTGRIFYGSYDRDGVSYPITDIVADEVLVFSQPQATP